MFIAREHQIWLKQYWLMQVWENFPPVMILKSCSLFTAEMWLTRYPRSARPTRATACSGFTLEWIIAGKWSPDGALWGSNGNLWIKWLNAAEAHAACDLYLIWFCRRAEGPQSSDSSFSGGRLHLFQSAELCTEKQALFLLATRQRIFLKHHDTVLWHWVDTDLFFTSKTLAFIVFIVQGAST